MKRYYHDYLGKVIRFVRPTILLNNSIGDEEDVYQKFSDLAKNANEDDRLLITYYNHLWEPVLKFASRVGWRGIVSEQNWLNDIDLANFLNLTGWEVITQQKRLLIPIYIPIISNLVNTLIAPLPFINSFCLLTWTVARLRVDNKKEYSVSIVIPARNEEKNIAKIIKRIPKFGKWQEIIFVEGHSKDGTWEEIKKLEKRNPKKKIYAYKQTGSGKADAVRLGFSKAKGELLMILDCDMTVAPEDLPKFYEAISTNKGEFINGSRLVYPMEKEAMRTLNKMGNKIFGWLFTWILGQRFKDTLCGTKVLLKSNYEKIVKRRSYFGDFDPFGDFDLIFGAIKLNLKVVEVPIRYKERTYGSTNISRFKHGLLLIKMTWIAYNKFILSY